MDSSLFSDETTIPQFYQPYSQSILGNEFAFQQTLGFHQGSVRSLGTLDSGYLLSGSVDTSTKLYMLNNATGRYSFEKEMKYHTGFVYSITPSQIQQFIAYRILQDGFFTGSKDTNIFKVDLLGNPVMLYEGHEDAVNSLSQCIPEELVSGSWDGQYIINKLYQFRTAKIWDVETGKVKETLGGHQYGVAVLTLPNGITLTGSADKKIRIWFKGNMEKEIDAHSDVIRDFVEIPGLGFASCSNDETVKIWTLDGQNLAELKGHNGFIFSLCTLDSGELLSASDDKTVKIWRDGTCVQTIDHPRTIWKVTKNHLGDIITGGEDYKIRTFTRDPSRVEHGEPLRDFEDEIKASQSGEQLNMDTLPTIQQMTSMKGKEGEIKVFKNGTNAEAYCWKGSQWEKIGDVISPPGGGQAKYYQGDQHFEEGDYDHIFDVDLGDGLLRKLPFDDGANALDSALKFIAREGLGRGYQEQVRAFIQQNSKNFATSDNANKKKGLFGSSAVQAPVKSKYQAMKDLLFFDQIAIDGPKKKLLEFNSETQIMDAKEIETLDSLLELIKNKAFYHSSKVSKQGYELVRKILKFPCDKAFPSLDIYRMFLMHPSSSENFKVFETGIESLSLLISYIREQSSPQATQLMGLRCIVNLFKYPSPIFILKSKRQFIVDNIAHLIQSDNKNVRNALITIYLNYSVLFLDSEDPEGKIQIISALSDQVSKETDEQNRLRLKTTLQNFMVNDNDAEGFINSFGINIEKL
ncbi:transducin family protein wd-40 repeat family protein [Stylonychia lemnae]|uniref:Transducin family protein wd-40 repeat family protein n=1 Tax=Stylonychia lemnae TaxID=5949 RepID=A0A078A0K3_STYLE|nr:transducin family protein wd-40 repeat family protein [Stylonychia lemnae]|eukprot:CDW75382.1 transducin family protein wd-40 repeat family protein [Stylonychia lemnae]